MSNSHRGRWSHDREIREMMLEAVNECRAERPRNDFHVDCSWTLSLAPLTLPLSFLFSFLELSGKSVTSTFQKKIASKLETICESSA